MAAFNRTAGSAYDLRTDQHFTLKKNPMKAAYLADAGYAAGNRVRRKDSDRFKRFDVPELLKRDKLDLDIFWLRNDSLADVDSLPSPDVIAAAIVENLQAALDAFPSVADGLAKPAST